MPPPFKPMLASLTERPFDRDGWIYEIKWDGYRVLAYISEGSVNLYSRNLKDLTGKFTAIADSLKSIDSDIILDGEVIIPDSEGRSDFDGLRDYLKTGKGSPVYYVFDILYADGYSLMDTSLRERKVLLESLLPPLAHVKVSGHVENTGRAFFREAAKNGLEGIMAKDASSIYRPSIRSRSWLKVKVRHTQDVAIGGYIRSAGGKSFRSVLTGIYRDGKLVYTGKMGSGFSQDTSQGLFRMMNRLVTSLSPFSDEVRERGDIVWTRPEIVAEAEFSQWTPDGRMRHPSFKGIRNDREPLEAAREKYYKAPSSHGQGAAPYNYRGKLSNPEKIFWPRLGYSKGDLFDYYRNVSDLIIPHLSGRPQSLHRYPQGINGEDFFQKDISFKPPDWIETYLVSDEKKKKDIHYLVCRDTDSLLYMVNLGCIEINPWLSRVEKIDCPDFIVIDLDPTGTGFDQVVKTASRVKEILDMLGVHSFLKTSGATGLHIYIPTGASYGYSQALQFANMLAVVITRKNPEISSIERSPAKRKGKVYIDYLQNRYGQTVAAPYSVRPRPSAPVSTPLFWDEIEELRDPAYFNMENIFKRLDKYGDIWKDIFKSKLDMLQVLSNMQKLYGVQIKRPL